jgi:DNA-binding transcriptional regulator PaaX
VNQNWLFLIYKIPREPSALRVGVWRKLNRLGAVLTHDSVWVLPENSRNKEQFQWLANDINQQSGSASVWVSKATLEGQDAALERAFLELVNPQYQELLLQLEAENPDLVTISKRYQQVKAVDHQRSKLGLQLQNALLKAKGEL